MSRVTGGKGMAWKQGLAFGFLMAAIVPQNARAQQAPVAPVSSSTPVVLTPKHAAELSLSNSKDIQLAKPQAHASQATTQLTRADSLPNLQRASGPSVTYGSPETP